MKNLDGEIIEKITLYIELKNYLRIVEKELERLLEKKLRESEDRE